MGGDTMIHAGFLLTGKEIARVIPRSKDDPDKPYVFGTWTDAPFTQKYYVQLIGKSFKKQFQLTSWISGKRPSKLTYTLTFNPPIKSRPDIPFSLVMTSRDCRVEYPVPVGVQPQNSETIACCGKQYPKYSQKFCGTCGKKLVAQDTIYIDELRSLHAHTPVNSGGDPDHHFKNLRKGIKVEKITKPALYYEDDMWDLGNAIGNKVGAHASGIGHLKDWVFLLSPKKARFSASLWGDEPYITLASIDQHREAIQDVGQKLKKLGFETEFVFHPEWVE